MKRFVVLLFAILCNVSYADTITVNFDTGNQTYETTTCETGGDIALPQQTPTKRGYIFQGWKLSTYIPLEYIENVPSETFFNTGFYPTENSKVVVDFVKTYYDSGVCEVTGAGKLLRVNASLNSNYPGIPVSVFNNKTTYVAESVSSTRHKYTLDKFAWYMDDVKKKDVNQQNAYFTSTTPMFIFSADANNPTPCVIRLYSLQFYQNDKLVHDYAPAKKTDGTVCLYDKVTGNFLYNLGTSGPVAGPAL